MTQQLANKRSKPQAAPIPSPPPSWCRGFASDLLQWYARHARDLPWRRTGDAYAITVSELMLQQTQVSTVLPYYERWLRLFPTWLALAAASEQEVLKAWEGLGYYSRARNLHRLAQHVVALGGELPCEEAALRELPGIGPYTAGAIASIAFGKRAAVVDGNVLRVLSRLFAYAEDIAKPAVVRNFWTLARELLPDAELCGHYNSALMELGATVCTPRNPNCKGCPVRSWCEATEPHLLPVKTKVIMREVEETIVLIAAGNSYLMEEIPRTERLGGMWRFPHYDADLMLLNSPFWQLSYTITCHRITASVQRAELNKTASLPTHWAWCDARRIERLPLPAAHRRIWKRVQEAALQRPDARD